MRKAAHVVYIALILVLLCLYVSEAFFDVNTVFSSGYTRALCDIELIDPTTRESVGRLKEGCVFERVHSFPIMASKSFMFLLHFQPTEGIGGRDRLVFESVDKPQTYNQALGYAYVGGIVECE